MCRFALPLLALPLALAACGEGPGTTVKVDAKGDGDGNASVSIVNGTIAVKGDGFEGTLKVPKFNITAGDFEVNGLKLYPGSVIRDLHVDAEERMGAKDKGKLRASFDAPAPLAAVQGWFRDNLAKRGFKVQPAVAGFAGTTRDGDPFRLELSADGDAKAKGRIEVGS